MYIEVLGLIATALVLVSALASTEVRIRKINIVGCLLFLIYGMLINAYSVWILNGVLIFVHIYKLYKIKRG